MFSIDVEVSDQPGCQKLSEAYILWSLDEVVLDTPGPIPSWVPVPGETIQGAGGYPCAGGAFCLNGYPRAGAEFIVNNTRRDRSELFVQDDAATFAEIVALDEERRLSINLSSTLTRLTNYYDGHELYTPISVGLSGVITGAELCFVEIGQ